jgi:hypothetical protein
MREITVAIVRPRNYMAVIDSLFVSRQELFGRTGFDVDGHSNSGSGRTLRLTPKRCTIWCAEKQNMSG